jgi:hypothetical protein
MEITVNKIKITKMKRIKLSQQIREERLVRILLRKYLLEMEENQESISHMLRNKMQNKIQMLKRSKRQRKRRKLKK